MTATVPVSYTHLEDKVKAVNPGATVVVDDKGNATVTTPSGNTAVIPAADLTKTADDAAKPNAGNDVVKPADKTCLLYTSTIQALLPHLDKGDILIDGGNTFYKDTIRRNEELANSGINFIGTGVSGGEKGALEGPSIMPGGQKEAYELVADVLEEISAKAPEDGKPCVTYTSILPNT